MRLTGPTIHPSRILAAIVLGLTPLLASAQTDMSDAARAEATPSAPSTPTSAPHKTSLMGVVMAALIESAEQSARERRDAARLAATLEATPPPGNAKEAVRTDPAWARQREDAIRKQQVAVQADKPL